MNLRRFGIATVVMASLGVGVWLMPKSPRARTSNWIDTQTPPPQDEAPQAMPQAQPGSASENNSASAGPGFSEREQRLIRDCLKVSNYEDLTSFDDFAERRRDNKSGNVLWRNVHLIDSSGTRRMIRISTESSSSGASYQRLQVATPDAQGLPDFLELSPSEEINPSPSVLEHYLSWGRPEFSESAEQIDLGDGASLYLEIENEKVREFIFVDRDARSVSCSRRSTNPEQRCRCIR